MIPFCRQDGIAIKNRTHRKQSYYFIMKPHFEGIRIISLNNNKFNRGSAVTIPGIGIFIGSQQINNTGLLRHEFGHILQYRLKGILFFWLIIAPASLWSSLLSSLFKSHIHMNTWTEWSANSLSCEYFHQPIDWDFIHYPVHSMLAD